MANLTVVATLKAKTGQEAELLSMLEGLLEPTREEEGCINYDLHRSADEPGTFLFHENWKSRELWDAHMASPHLIAFREKQGDLTESWQLFVGRRLDQPTGRQESQ